MNATVRKIYSRDEIKTVLDDVLKQHAIAAAALRAKQEAWLAHDKAQRALRELEARAVEAVRGHHGSIRHCDEIFRVVDGRLVHEPLGEDLDAQQDLLQAGAHR